MKKKMLGVLVLATIGIGISEAVLAEETLESSTKEVVETVVKEVTDENAINEEISEELPIKKETIETKETEEGITNDEVLAIVKADVSFVLKRMRRDYKISDDQLNEFLQRLDKIETKEEGYNILEEARRLGTETFQTQVYHLKERVNQLVIAGKMTEAKGNEFIIRLEACQTVEELNLISQDIEAAVNLEEWTFDDYYTSAKVVIEEYMKSGKLTQEQAKGFMEKLKSAKTIEEIWEIEREVSEQVKLNEDLAKWSFAEKYANVKGQIELLMEQGKLTKEQGAAFLAQVEASKTVQELDAIWQAVEKQVADNQKKVEEPNESNEKVPTTNKDNSLPKTGESRTILLTVFGLGVLGLCGGYLLFKKAK